MLRMFWNSKTALNANQNKMEIVSNNLTNMDTTGYKKINMDFQDLLQETLNRKGYPVSDRNADSLKTGTGTKSGKAIRNYEQGPLKVTNMKTDFAIDGDGFFRLFTSAGKVAYSRAGNFNIDVEGKLVDSSGNLVSIVDDFGREISGRVRLDKNNFFVNEEGQIFRNVGNRSEKVGNLGIYSVTGDDSLTSIGESLYEAKEGVNLQRSNDYNVYQGYLENSNVNIAEEMTDLILTQRAFQINSTALKTADEMWGMTNNMVRR